jgi:hypothetical protein
VLVTAGAAAANLALLDSAGEDRLGRLRPIDPALDRATTGAPATVDGAGADRAAEPGDDGGRGRGRGRGGGQDD